MGALERGEVAKALQVEPSRLLSQISSISDTERTRLQMIGLVEKESPRSRKIALFTGQYGYRQ